MKLLQISWASKFVISYYSHGSMYPYCIYWGFNDLTYDFWAYVCTIESLGRFGYQRPSKGPPIFGSSDMVAPKVPANLEGVILQQEGAATSERIITQQKGDATYVPHALSVLDPDRSSI